jgi:hypothetical protein
VHQQSTLIVCVDARLAPSLNSKLPSLPAQYHDGSSAISASPELRELLAAALANSHACQNWLADPTPNLDRARLSIAGVTRDLDLVVETFGA